MGTVIAPGASVAISDPTYDYAFEYLMSNEGGLIENAADPGGLTNFGLSQRSFPSISLRTVTRDQAKALYRSAPPAGSSVPYWVPLYSSIHDRRVAAKIFDMAVNMGPGTAHEIVQEALGMSNPTQVFGPIMLGTVNRTPADSLLDELAARAALHYHQILLDITRDAQFALGWFRRAVRTPK